MTQAITENAMKKIATKVDVKATRDQLALPQKQLRQLLQIAHKVEMRGSPSKPKGRRNRLIQNTGITALFAGASGTGKPMAAEVLANELNLGLYRINLSSIASKYIGETEKNLDRLFDEVKEHGAVLFFDEADALFGKRSEVKDSHDRYANIEVSYLLQRMEAFPGLAILSTNKKSVLDKAFTRRFRFTVDFPFPDVEQRKNQPHPAELSPRLQFNPNDPGDIPYRLQRAVKESGLSAQQICDRMKSVYNVELTKSALSRSINRGTLSLHRALQLLAVCGVVEIEIKGSK